MAQFDFDSFDTTSNNDQTEMLKVEQKEEQWPNECEDIDMINIKQEMCVIYTDLSKNTLPYC